MILENGKYGHLIELGDKYKFSNTLIKELNNPNKKDESLSNYSKNSLSKMWRNYILN